MGAESGQSETDVEEKTLTQLNRVLTSLQNIQSPSAWLNSIHQNDNLNLFYLDL